MRETERKKALLVQQKAMNEAYTNQQTNQPNPSAQTTAGDQTTEEKPKNPSGLPLQAEDTVKTSTTAAVVESNDSQPDDELLLTQTDNKSLEKDEKLPESES